MKAKQIHPKTEKDWLKVRSKGVGASEVASVLGINPYQTPYQLWLQKTGQAEPFKGNEHTEAGKEFEEPIARLFEKKTGHRVIKRSAGDVVYQLKEKPHILCTPDRRLFLKDRKGQGLLECKLTNKHITSVEDMDPRFGAQLVYQLGIVGFDIGFLAVLPFSRKLVDLPIEFTDTQREFFRFMVEKVDEFWLKNVMENIPPEAVNLDDVRSMYSRSMEGAIVNLDGHMEVLESLNTLNVIKQARKALDEKEEQHRMVVEQFIKENEVLMEGDSILATYKTQNGREGFDTKKFREDHPELYNKYKKQGKSFRVLRIKEDNVTELLPEPST